MQAYTTRWQALEKSHEAVKSGMQGMLNWLHLHNEALSWIREHTCSLRSEMLRMLIMDTKAGIMLNQRAKPRLARMCAETVEVADLIQRSADPSALEVVLEQWTTMLKTRGSKLVTVPPVPRTVLPSYTPPNQGECCTVFELSKLNQVFYGYFHPNMSSYTPPNQGVLHSV